MQTAVSRRQSSTPQVILCETLPAFDRTELESVRTAFREAVPCSFWQAWLDGEAANFSPGTVRVGCRAGSLSIFAQMTDADIFSRATQLNQRTWELGDVLEIFLRGAENESYVEFHVTPNNQRLQLRYPNSAAVNAARKTNRFGEFLIGGEAFYSRTWIESEKNQWCVYAEISTSVVHGSHGPVGNSPWRFSFGRYDYTGDFKEPVISSTSAHLEPDFHRHHEWDVMNFSHSNHQ